jgi:hypothetical protein
MKTFEEITAQWFDNTMSNAVRKISSVIEECGLNPYDNREYGNIYKKIKNDVNIDFRTMCLILKNWIFINVQYA